MTTKLHNCPQCGSEMSFRLGVYECPQCGEVQEEKTPAEARGGSSGPGFRGNSWQSARTKPQPTAPFAGQSEVDLGSRPHFRKDLGAPSYSAEDDWRPAPGKEKMLMLSYFLIKGLVSALIAITVIGSSDWQAVGGTLFNQLIAIGLMALVLYIPVNVIKNVVGFCACAYGLISLVSLILGLIMMAIMTPILGMMSHFEPGFHMQLLWLISLLLALADIFGYLWLASLLFRDLENW